MEVIRALDAASGDDFKTDAERGEAMRAAHAFLSRVEPPFARLAALTCGNPALVASLKIMLELDLFKKWDDAGDSKKTYEELAHIAGVEPDGLRRLLRHMASMLVLAEVGPETYEQTSFTRSLRDPSLNCWINYYYDACGPVYLQLPKYMKEHSYQPPTEPKDGVFQATFDCKGNSLFEYYAEHPDRGATFNQCMTGYTGHRTGWVDVFPTESLINGSTHDAPLVVDVGGNVGYDMDKFRVKHPEHASRLVLQDLPEVIAKADCGPEIQRMAYDFFTPQPIKGARAYYLHSVLHDWSDPYARKILANTKDAMKPGYSKLLVNDNVMSSFHPPAQITTVDMMMMVKVAAMERNSAQFHSLLESVGFKVVKIWESASAVTSIIEAEVPV